MSAFQSYLFHHNKILLAVELGTSTAATHEIMGWLADDLRTPTAAKMLFRVPRTKAQERISFTVSSKAVQN